MIESVKTKKQIEMVKSGLEPCCLALVKSLNGNHVIQTCLTSLGPKDNKVSLKISIFFFLNLNLMNQHMFNECFFFKYLHQYNNQSTVFSHYYCQVKLQHFSSDV